MPHSFGSSKISWRGEVLAVSHNAKVFKDIVTFSANLYVKGPEDMLFLFVKTFSISGLGAVHQEIFPKPFSALNPRAHGKQSRQFASSNMMKKNNSVHIRVPINSSKLTNQRLLFVVFIRTPTKKYAEDLPVVALVLLYELCQNACNGTSTLEELLLDFFLNTIVSNVTISRNISKFTIYLCNEYKL